MGEFKSPNLKGKRRRSKVASFANRQLYKEYCKENPDIKISYEKFKEVIVTYGRCFVEEVYNNMHGAELPLKLGTVFIAACDFDRKVVDYKRSKELGKTVYHNNWGTNGKMCKIFYTKGARAFKHQSVWYLEANRTFSRGASAVFREEFEKFRFIPKFINASSYRTKRK
jgi:hypothetical protein